MIQFDPTVFSASTPQTITLTSTLELSGPSGPEVIEGPGANVVTISGNNAVQVFHVGSATTATITGLTIADGNGGANHSGSGIDNQGMLTVAGCTIADNSPPNPGDEGYAPA